MTTRRNRNSRRRLVGFALAAFGALALGAWASDSGSHPKLTDKPLLAGSGVPAPVRAILQRACQDCHSENTVWPWYSHIPPISWGIRDDVKKGRAFLDLSKWNDYTDAERLSLTVGIGSAVRANLMPPGKYVWIHNEARLSSDDRELIRLWAVTSQRHGAEADSPHSSAWAPDTHPVR
jgi:hypothetical protein